MTDTEAYDYWCEMLGDPDEDDVREDRSIYDSPWSSCWDCSSRRQPGVVLLEEGE